MENPPHFSCHKIERGGKKKRKEETLSSQIWLNLLWYDPQFGYITKIEEKKKEPKLVGFYFKPGWDLGHLLFSFFFNF
jgi:hypothetical protein